MYRAHDTKLGREVALRILPDGTTSTHDIELEPVWDPLRTLREYAELEALLEILVPPTRAEAGCEIYELLVEGSRIFQMELVI